MSPAATAFLHSIHPLPPEALEALLQHMQCLEYPKNFVLLRQGRPCKHLWFLVKGAAVYIHANAEGKDSNVWFSIDRDIITDTPSFINQAPSNMSIQLLEDSELYAIEYDSIQHLLHRHHAFAIWYIRMFEKHYVSQIEDRIADLQFLSAKQRYEKLLAQFPDIGNRISLGHIASYLNITQETLSRIRAGRL